MPNVWTHSIYGEMLLEKLGRKQWISDPVAGAIFRFGCQGPDPLFYHRFYPWMKRASQLSDRIGSTLHKQRCGVFLRALLNGCAGVAPDDARTVYAIGWLTHHTLDRTAHPFVFAREGARRRDHQRLETAIDTIVAERLRGIDTLREPVRPTLDAGRRFPGPVARLVEDAIRRTYPEFDTPHLEGLWQQSYTDMLNAFSLFHDPSGVKRTVLGGAIEPFVPGRRGDPDDPVNERRDGWTPPEEPTKTSRDTFWDVFDQALEDGERVLGAACDWLAATARQGTVGASLPGFAAPGSPHDAAPVPSTANDAAAEDVPNDADAAWRAFTDALGDRSYETGLAAEA